jgi:hypothetical protein
LNVATETLRAIKHKGREVEKTVWLRFRAKSA